MKTIRKFLIEWDKEVQVRMGLTKTQEERDLLIITEKKITQLKGLID